MDFNSIIHIVAGPIIGSIIGYFTNYIAVRMLFRPLNPVRIGSCTLPFTPGIIPRNKNRIAEACGNAVGKDLLTREDMKSAIFNDTMESRAVDFIVELMHDEKFRNITVKTAGEGTIGEAAFYRAKCSVKNYLGDRIKDAIMNFDVQNFIIEEGGKLIKEKTKDSMLSMFINDNLIESLASPISDKFYEYINTKGDIKIRDTVSDEVDNFCNIPAGNMIDSIVDDENSLRETARAIYRKIADMAADTIFGNLKIANMVENKINEMDVEQFERLVLSVMKKELNSIVRLGALIGLVIGIVNIFI